MELSFYSAEENEKVAREASLRYVKDNSPGISRKRCGKGFAYYQDGQIIKDRALINRIRALAIPPAYHDVWICPHSNGHIQATGRDKNNKKQYRYHPLWQQIREHHKFNSMIDFGHALKAIRAHVEEEISKPIKLSKSQVICAILYLLDNSSIRIGNPVYATQNQSYGLTTLRKKHLSMQRNQALLHFKGKSKQLWQVVLKDRKIIRVLKKCEEIPGYELFKYRDEQGLNVITSQEVNNYLQNLTNHPFTAKNFRTWTACRETLQRLIVITFVEEESSSALKQVIREVASLLGHSVSICQKNYIYPEIISAWQEKRLSAWAEEHKKKILTLNEDELLLFWLELHTAGV